MLRLDNSAMGDDDGLTTLKVAEIRQRCLDAGIPSDGLKGQLIARLREHAAKLDTAESEPEVTNESNSTVEFLGSALLTGGRSSTYGCIERGHGRHAGPSDPFPPIPIPTNHCFFTFMRRANCRACIPMTPLASGYRL